MFFLLKTFNLIYNNRLLFIIRNLYFATKNSFTYKKSRKKNFIIVFNADNIKIIFIL